MASNVITSTYIGKDSKEFISPILLAGRTLGVPGVTIHNNVNYKSRLTSLNLEGILVDQTCDFTPEGAVNIGEVWLNVKPLQVNLQLCKSDFYEDFIGQDMGPYDNLPASFLTYLLGEIGGSVADSIETMIWQGTAIADSFLGIEGILAAGAGPVLPASGNTVPSGTTIIAEVRKVIAAGKPAMIGKSDAYIYVSTTSYQALREAFNDKNSASACGEDCMAVDGVSIFLAPGLTPGAMVYAQKSNLHFGTWNTSNIQSVKVVDTSETLLDNNVRLAMTFFAGVQVGKLDETVYYESAV